MNRGEEVQLTEMGGGIKMSETVKQLAETIVSHPKVSVALVAASQANVRWMDYAEPYIKDITNILGVTVLFLLVIKHVIDIVKSLKSNDK